MGIRFYVTPYDPAAWKDERIVNLPEQQSDLQINFGGFLKEARNFFPHVAGYSSNSWEVLTENRHGVSGAFIGSNNQILVLQPNERFDEFVMWYRAYIPAKYPLHLFAEGEWNSLQITTETTEKDVASFSGTLLR